MANFLDTIDALEEIKSRDEEYIMLIKQAAELKWMKEKLCQAEFEQLKQEVYECKLYEIILQKQKLKRDPKKKLTCYTNSFTNILSSKPDQR